MDEKDIEYFEEETINASLGNIVDAIKELTPVEFRLWVLNCIQFPNSQWSHFAGLEEAFVRTGKWELPEGEEK